jgi:ribosomal protein L44E
MPEHYTKNTVQVSVWCKPCGKMTRHRVDSGRRGPCLECMEKNEKQRLERAKPKTKPVQMEMFP